MLFHGAKNIFFARPFQYTCIYFFLHMYSNFTYSLHMYCQIVALVEIAVKKNIHIHQNPTMYLLVTGLAPRRRYRWHGRHDVSETMVAWGCFADAKQPEQDVEATKALNLLGAHDIYRGAPFTVETTQLIDQKTCEPPFDCWSTCDRLFGRVLRCRPKTDACQMCCHFAQALVDKEGPPTPAQSHIVPVRGPNDVLPMQQHRIRGRAVHRSTPQATGPLVPPIAVDVGDARWLWELVAASRQLVSRNGVPSRHQRFEPTMCFPNLRRRTQVLPDIFEHV